MRIKEGDYINGRLVEEVAMIGQERHYLITYFCTKHMKPQSIWLPEHKVQKYVSAEAFKGVNNAYRKG
ncbi:MAG TPA: hypothetical protein DCM01_07550 [Dielma fastidiosa]|jgi:hypothetical protein|nr:hypothetical protein [Dielma fastidiosa]